MHLRHLFTIIFMTLVALTGFNSSAAVKINFNVSTADGYQFDNPGELVTISYFDNQEFKDVTVEITDNKGFVNSEKLNFANFDIVPASGYLIDKVTSSSSRVSVSPPPANDKTGTWNLSVTNGTGNSEVTVDIEISKAGAMAYFNFTSVKDNIYNPYMYVTASTSKGNLPINSSARNKVYIDTGITVTVRSDNAEFAIADMSASLDSEPIDSELLPDYGCLVTETNGVYTLQLSPEADGINFTFDIEKVTSSSGKEISFTIVAEEFESPEAFECLKIVVDMLETIIPDENVFTYFYPENADLLELMFVPEQGYTIGDIICETINGKPFGQVIYQDSGVFTGSWQLSIPGDPELEIPDSLNVAVIVKEADTNGISISAEDTSDERIHNLQGIPASRENLSPGIYIVNGKKIKF